MANWKKVIVSGSQAELNSLALDTALTVANGGTGASTLTDGGVLLGSGTGAITATAVLTNGQLLIGDGTGDPTVSTLTAGTGVTITNGAGSIEIAAAGSGGTVTEVDATGTVNGITLTTSPGAGITGTGTVQLGGTLSGITNLQLDNDNISLGGVSVSLGGSDATPAFNLADATGLPLTTGVSGILPIANGGTNISSYTTGDILYASSGTALAKLAIGTSGQILAVSSGGIVEWINNDEGDITSVANTTNGGLTVTNGTGPDVTLTLNLNDLSAAAVDVAADSIAIIDANDSNTSRKETIADLATAMAGTGITATNGVLSANDTTSSLYTNITGDVSITAAGVSSVNSVQANSVALGTDTTGNYVATLGSGTGVTIGSNTGEGSTPTIAVDYGTGANTAAQGNVGVTFAGTANEIELSTNTFTTVGGGGSVTIGLPNDVTIGNNLTVANNAIISGDLTVSGTASFTHSDNLDVADKFITLSSGSTSAGDGGIIVAQSLSGGGPTQKGEAFGFNAQAGGAGRWGITGSLDNDAGAIVALDQMVTARSSTAAPSSAPRYGGTSGYGNMHIDTNNEDIYIYV